MSPRTSSRPRDMIGATPAWKQARVVLLVACLGLILALGTQSVTLALLLTISGILVFRAVGGASGVPLPAPAWIETTALGRAVWGVTDPLGLTVFAGYTIAALLWLALGLAPALAHAWLGVHDTFHAWARGPWVLASLSERIATASHAAEPAGQVVLDYLFSALNLGLGLFLVYLRPRDLPARLLAVGMIGTAVAFNLQGHDALQLTSGSWLGVVDGWHSAVHVVSGVHYVYALLLFPDGRLLSFRRSVTAASRLPFIVFATLFFALFSAVTIEDHTVGLVIVFGIFIPIAGVISQARRYRRAPNHRERQQSRLLLMALSIALVAAVILMASVILAGSSPAAHKTLTYEFVPPAPGIYFFRCDPHPVDMVGELVVEAGGGAGSATPQTIRISAEGSRFDKEELRLTAGRPARVLFTNHDSDFHNVAVYDGPRVQRAIFVGEEFSGQDLAGRIFRVFRLLFFALPIALFVGILRFHLWDIDRVINRALVYTVLTGVLAAIYFGSVVLLGGVLRKLALVEANDVALAASTLGVAALFRPAQRRVQAVIDRRFFRKKYDAEKTIETFGRRMRDHIELETITRELIEVTRSTVEPSHVSLWLRGPSRSERETTVAHVPEGDETTP